MSQYYSLSDSIHLEYEMSSAQDKIFARINHNVKVRTLTKTVWRSWWRHHQETFPALLALIERNSPVTGGFPSQRPVALIFDVFFDLWLNKLLSKQSRRQWFETPSRSLWRHCDDNSDPHDYDVRQYINAIHARFIYKQIITIMLLSLICGCRFCW